MQVEFEAVCGPKFMTFWDNVACRRHLVVVNAVDRLSISCFIPKIQAVKVAVKLRSRPKKVVFGPPICRGRWYPRFRICVFKLHSLLTMWPISLSSVQGARRLGGEKRRRKKKESLVKHKSADILCRAA